MEATDTAKCNGRADKYRQEQRLLVDRFYEPETIGRHKEHPLGRPQGVGEQASIKEEVTGTSC